MLSLPYTDDDSILKYSILQSCLTPDKYTLTAIPLVTPASPTSTAYQESSSPLVNLPTFILLQVFQYVDQFDLINLAQTCKGLYPIAASRLYKRVTVILSPELPVRFKKDQKEYIRECGIKSMDSSLILTIDNLMKFLTSLHTNPKLIQKIKFFVFDKCFINEAVDISYLQSKIIEFFGINCNELNFLHITFVEFMTGVVKLTKFLKHDNIRNKIFKLFVTKSEDLYEPNIPKSLTNLFFMLNEVELMGDDDGVPIKKENFFDLSTHPYEVFNTLSTLTCSTNNQIGLELLKSIKLIDDDYKLKLRGLSVFHCHKEDFTSAIDVVDIDRFLEFMNKIDTKLAFSALDSKIELTWLSHLFLKVDCMEGSHPNCTCFADFFKDFRKYSLENNGLPNLVNFELESYPNLEWLRPHQILENILTPLGLFIGTLSSLDRLTIDFATPGFKMFDNNMAMSSVLLNKLNERLMDAFFLSYFTPRFGITTLQLPDFLTSFIYYRPDFYESLLHTCQCTGCDLVLQRLKTLFYPIKDLAEESHDPNDPRIDSESAYYLIGYILGRLQADREVCIPIKDKIYEYRNYPIYKGQPHTLHHGFHNDEVLNIHDECDCDITGDPNGTDEMNIDNLVTTYVIHQLKPIVKYLSKVFDNLNSLMIHGVYYELQDGNFVAIFDDGEYPGEFVVGDETIEEDVKFGSFRT